MNFARNIENYDITYQNLQEIFNVQRLTYGGKPIGP